MRVGIETEDDEGVCFGFGFEVFGSEGVLRSRSCMSLDEGGGGEEGIVGGVEDDDAFVMNGKRQRAWI